MFRFTIRDVLWLMVVVGMGVGWWADNRRLSEHVAKTNEQLTRLALERTMELSSRVPSDEKVSRSVQPLSRPT